MVFLQISDRSIKDMQSIIKLFRKLRERVSDHPYLDAWLPSLLTAFLLTLAVVSLGLRNPVGGFVLLFRRPLCFLINLAILHTTVAVAALFPHRSFGTAVVCILWMLLGITDFIMMLVRNSPLAGNDFSVFITGFNITFKYLKFWHILLIALGFLLVGAVLVLLFRRLPKKRSQKLPALLHLIGTAALTALLICTAHLTGSIPEHFSDMAKAYDTYGFPYCFAQSLFDRGVGKPAAYNDSSLSDIAARLSSSAKPSAEKKPNIIILQLESFWDVNELRDISFSENPIPTFTSLVQNGPSGFLSVPSIGGGTANTEFEVLTGMNLDHFGVGEYPYYTILKNTACESVAYDLSQLGYTAHALHNYTGSFYERNIAYGNLGFDTFTPLEYMTNPSFNAIGWANDSILTEQIMTALRSTDSNDFVFTVTVQGHGQYPSEPSETPEKITVSGISDSALLNQYTYYVNQLYETDAFLADLLSELEAFGEDTVVVAYGDHLPALFVEQDDLKQGSLYQTKYAVWSNFDLIGEDVDLEAYQLTAHVFELLGIHAGTLPRFHAVYRDQSNYQALLELLEYDMLYGSRQIYGGTSPFKAKTLRFGLRPIRITGAVQVGHDLFITGENFTESGRITVNGKQKTTDYLSDTLLRIRYTAKPDDVFTVVQVTDTLARLGASDPYRYSVP